MVTIAEILQNIFKLDQIQSEIIAAITIFSIAATVGWLSYYIFQRFFSRWAAKTETKIDDAILHNIKIVAIFSVIILGFYYSLSTLSFMVPYTDILYYVFGIFEILLIAFAITRVTNVLFDWYAFRNAKLQEKNVHLLFIMKKVVQIVVYIGALLAVLVVFKIDLSNVIVGLGVGGIAIALAIQSTLSDVFSAFSIYFDRPFEIGDFIMIGDHSGTVKSIGVKSTRIQLLQGEELVISNRELTETHLRNFRKLEKRRVLFNIGVTYDTPVGKLGKIPEIITKIIENVELAELDRVHFIEFGDFSLRFEIVYYVSVSDYVKYMDTQQKINFAIKEAFEKEGIEIAFPTQTIYMAK